MRVVLVSPCVLLGAALSLAAPFQAAAAPTVITFDDIPARTAIDKQYPGIKFNEPLHNGPVYAVPEIGGNGNNLVSIHLDSRPAYENTFAAEEGAVDVTFATPQRSVSIDASIWAAVEDPAPTTRRPYLQVFDAQGKYLETTYYNLAGSAWQTLTITRPSADIQRLRFSSQNNFAGTACHDTDQPGCPNRFTAGGRYGEFDNLRYDDQGPGLQYQGCYTDDGARALPVQLIASGATVESCVAAAAAKRLPYAGLQWRGTCFAGRTLGYSKVADSECNTSCANNPSEACGGAWRSSVYATGVGTSPPVLSNYVGCYTDDQSRALPVLIRSSGADVESCLAAARARGLAFAGLQWHGQCFGGNALGRSKAPESECNTRCDANSSEVCGGAWRNSVYQLWGVPPPPPVLAANYRGCFTDQEERALPVVLMTSGATVESCVAAAREFGYPYAGVQYYGQCFAGERLRYFQTDEAKCDTPCTAAPGEPCGGSWMNSVWSTQ